MERPEVTLETLTDRIEDISECIDILAETTEDIFSTLQEICDVDGEQNDWLNELTDKLACHINPDLLKKRRALKVKFKKFTINKKKNIYK